MADPILHTVHVCTLIGTVAEAADSAKARCQYATAVEQ